MTIEKFKNYLIFKHIIFIILIVFSSNSWGSARSDNESTGSQRARLITLEEINQYPHNAVLSLESHFIRGKLVGYGTGFLISKKCALTSAHVVYSLAGGHADNVICHIRQKGENKIIKQAVRHYIISKSYLSKVGDDVKTSKHLKKEEKDNLFSKRIYSGEDYALLFFGNEGINIENIDPLEIHSGNINVISGILSDFVSSLKSMIFSLVGHKEEDTVDRCLYEKKEITLMMGTDTVKF